MEDDQYLRSEKDEISMMPLMTWNIEKFDVRLGERGQVWWTDGAPDSNRHMVGNTPYADWYSRLSI